jgi:hypothetical protein
MKTTIDIPDQQLKEAMRHSKAHTKREAVLAAIEEYNRRHRMAALISLSGTCTELLTNDELEAIEMRSAVERKTKITKHNR